MASTSRASSHWASKNRAPPRSPRSRIIGSASSSARLPSMRCVAHCGTAPGGRTATSRRPAARGGPGRPVHREDEGQGPHQVGRDAEQDPPLAVGFEHQLDVAGLEVAQAPVDQPARPRAGARAEVPAARPARCASPRIAASRAMPAPVMPPPIDQQVGRLGRELLERRPPRGTTPVTLPPVSPDHPSQHLVSVACSSDPPRHAGARSGLRRRPPRARRGGAGAKVTAVDRDPGPAGDGAQAGRGAGSDRRLGGRRPGGPWPELGAFDAVLVFNYLDRARMPEVVAAGGPRRIADHGNLPERQRELGWGPSSDDHLLRPGELARLVAPLDGPARARGGRGGRRRALERDRQRGPGRERSNGAPLSHHR